MSNSLTARTIAVMGLLVVFLCLCLRPHADAATEFCPASLHGIYTVSGMDNVYAFRLTALSPRHATGSLEIETNNGWFAVPFPPTPIAKHALATDSEPAYMQLPPNARILNVWLAQAASDDPQWGPKGLITCPPLPHRTTPTTSVPAVTVANNAIAAHPVPAPFTWNCPEPFKEPTIKPESMEEWRNAPGFNDELSRLGPADVTLRIDLDANAKLIDVTVVTFGSDFTEARPPQQLAKHVRYTPAIAYCRPVPSTTFLMEHTANP